MVQDTEVLFTATTSNATGRGSVFRLRAIHERTHEAIQVTISAGTGTINIEGRASQNEAWVVLATTSASDIFLLPAGLEISVNVTAAAGLTARVAAARPAAFVA